MAKKLDGFVARLTALGGGSGSSLDIYEDWAPTYEDNLLQDYGYIAPRIAADAYAAHCGDQDGRILDLGCGTGLVGQELSARGFRHMDGLDISPAMLEQARRKGIYGELLERDMTVAIDLGGRRYDAAIGVGCFGGGHLGPQHLAGIIRCVRPGGLLIFYINAIPYDEDDYPAHFRALEEDGIWRLASTEPSNYMQALDRPGWVVAAHRT
ncbi:MAG: methyltransferase domain-containing protein [Alphaproteobacteria bacterium]|nr:methyltransferase domain-containing protein [Alphaproteobacteria bacterium]MDP6829481.1 methyltransferase domain-containing protein [Alphaproteobacteria bacterium]MDP6872176.1 methyltransferase domain-containing protein [Alphaproteobacteria bacterium]